jgi:Spy/CpxP family protein refolding chaperone
MMKRMVILAAIAAGAMTAQAQHDMPQGRWWKRPAIAARLELTREQQQKLDDVFQTAANELIDAKADVRKIQVALRAELERPTVRRDEVRRIGAQLSSARAKLFDRELMMLVDMRGVLDEHQWTQLQEARESMRTPEAPRAPGSPRRPRTPRPPR